MKTCSKAKIFLETFENRVVFVYFACSTKSKSKLIGGTKQRRGHVRSSSRVHFVGLTPSEPSSPADSRPTTDINRPIADTVAHVGHPSNISLPASSDNDELDYDRRSNYAMMGSVNNASDTLPRPVQPATSAAAQVGFPVLATGLPVLAASGSTVRRTLYSPRYTSDGRLKHYLATTSNDILSTQY